MSFRSTTTFSPFCRQPESGATVLWMPVLSVSQLREAAAAALQYFRGSPFLPGQKMSSRLTSLALLDQRTLPGQKLGKCLTGGPC